MQAELPTIEEGKQEASPKKVRKHHSVKQTYDLQALDSLEQIEPT